MPSPLYVMIEKFVGDEWIRLDREKITPWAFFNAGKDFRTVDFYGKVISYSSIRFQGSPRDVFWCRYLNPFLEDVVLRTIDEVLRLAVSRKQSRLAALEDSKGILKSLVRRAFYRMADIDRRLRGNGFPESVALRNVDGNIAMLDEFIDGRFSAELQMLDDGDVMNQPASVRTSVFISYSHADERFRKKVTQHLGVLEKQGLLRLWDDRKIVAGQDWNGEINDEMSCAKVALLLISSSFLTSSFILEKEVPRIFDRHKNDGMVVYPLLVKPCSWQVVPWLTNLQLRPLEAKPVSLHSPAQQERVLADMALEMASMCRS